MFAEDKVFYDRCNAKTFLYRLPVTILKDSALVSDNMMMKFAEKWFKRNSRIITLENGFKLLERMRPFPYFFKAYEIRKKGQDILTEEDEISSAPLSIIVERNILKSNPEIKFYCRCCDNLKKLSICEDNVSDADDINMLRAHPVHIVDAATLSSVYFISDDDDEARRLAMQCCDPDMELNYDVEEYGEPGNFNYILHNNNKFQFCWLKELLCSLFKLLFCYDIKEKLMRDLYDRVERNMMILTTSGGLKVLKVEFTSVDYDLNYNYAAWEIIRKIIADENITFFVHYATVIVVDPDKEIRKRINFFRVDKEKYNYDSNNSLLVDYNWAILLLHDNNSLINFIEDSIGPEK